MGSGASKKDTAALNDTALNALKEQNSALQSQLNAASISEKRSQELLIASNQKAKQLEEALAHAKDLAARNVKVVSPRVGVNIPSPRGDEASFHPQSAQLEVASKTGKMASPRVILNATTPRVSAVHAVPSKFVPPINTAAAAPSIKVGSSSSFSNLAAASLSSRGAVTARNQLLRSVPGATPSMLSERLISVPLVSNRIDDSFSTELLRFASSLQQRLQREFSLKLQIVDVFGGRSGFGAISAPELRMFVHFVLRCHPHCIMLLSDADASRATSNARSPCDIECSVLPTAFFTTVSHADGLNDIISSIQSAKPSSILEVALFTSRLFNSKRSCLLAPQKPSPVITDYVLQVLELAEAASVLPQQYLDRPAIFRLIEADILKWAASFPPISNLAPLWTESHLCRAFGRVFPEALSALAAPFDRLLTSALEFGSSKIALIVSDAIDCDIAVAAALFGKKGKFTAIQVPFLRSAAMDTCYRNCASLLQTIVAACSDDQNDSGMGLAARSLSTSPPSLGEVVWMPQLQRKDSTQHIIVLSESLSSEARRFTNVTLSPGTAVVCMISAADAQVQPMLGWKLIPCSFLAGYERSSILQVLASFGFVFAGSAVSALPSKISCNAAHVAIQHARSCAALALPTSCLGEILMLTDSSDILVPVVLFIESVVDVTLSSGPLKNLFFDVLLLCSLSWRGPSYQFMLQFTGCAPFHLNMLLQILDGFIIQACGLYCIASEILAKYFQHRFLKQPTESQRFHKSLFEFYWAIVFTSQDAALEVLYHSCASGSSSSIMQVIGSFELLILLASSTARPFLLSFLERAEAIVGSQVRSGVVASCEAFIPSTKSSAINDASQDSIKGMAGNLSWADAQQFLEFCTADRARCCCFFLLHESFIAAPSFSSLQFDTESGRADGKMISLSCSLLNFFLSKGNDGVIVPDLAQFSCNVYLPWLFGPVCLRMLSLDAVSNAAHLLALRPFLSLCQSDMNKPVYMQPSLFLFYARIALSLGDAELSRNAIQMLQNDVISWCELHLGPVHPFTVSAYALRSLHLMIIASVSDAASSIRQAISALRSIDSVPFESKVLSDAISLPLVPNSSKSAEFTFSKDDSTSKDAVAYLLRGEWCWRIACIDVARASAALLMYRGESSDALPLLAYCRSSCWSINWDDSLGSLSVPSLSLFLAFSSGRLDLAMQQIKIDKVVSISDDIALDVRLWAGDIQSLDGALAGQSGSSISWRFRVLSLMPLCSDTNSALFKQLHIQNMQALQASIGQNGMVDAALYLVHAACACLIISQELDVAAFAQASAVISRQYGSRHVFCILAQLAHAVALLSSGSISGARQVFSTTDGLLQSSMYPYSSCLFLMYCSIMSYWASIPSLCSLAEASVLHLSSQISNAKHPVLLYSISSFVSCAAALGKVDAVSEIVRQISNVHTESASAIGSETQPSSMQQICSVVCSAANSFASGAVIAYQSKYKSALQLRLDSASFLSSAMHWWCQRHSGIHVGSDVAILALRACFEGKVTNALSLFAASVYLSGTIFSSIQTEISNLREVIELSHQRRQDAEPESGGILPALFLHAQVDTAISNGDVEAQGMLLVRAGAHAHTTNRIDNAVATSSIAIARIHCNRTSYFHALGATRVFADAKCMSFDIQLEWCLVVVEAATDCSDLLLIRTCLRCLETLKQTASDSDVIFQIIYNCCCCMIFASEDKFVAAQQALSCAKTLSASVSEQASLPVKLQYLLLCSSACMYQLRRSYQLAHECYVGLQSIYPDTHDLTISASVNALEMQIVLSDLPAGVLVSKLDALSSLCTKFPNESSVFACLSRSRAFLLERSMEFDKSEEQFRSIVIKADVGAFGSVNERLAWDHVCLGRLYMQRLQTSLAESALIDAFKIYRAIRGDQNSRIALILFELASVYERYGSYSQAFDRACKSIKILDRIPREGHWSACEAYLGLGKFMLVIDNWSSSLEYLSMAAAGFDDLQGPQAIPALESAAYAAFAEHLISCDAESLRKSKRRIFSVLSNIASAAQPASSVASSASKDSLNFTPSIEYAKWLSCVGACNIFSCNAMAKRYIVTAKNICETFSSSVAATLEPLLILAYMLHGRYSKAATFITARIPPGLLVDTGRRNALNIGVEHADLLHAGAMLQYAICNYKYASELLRLSKAVLSNQTSEGSDWTQHSVKMFRIDAIETILCSETGASLKTIDSAKILLDRFRLGNNHLLHHILIASQIHSDIWKGCFSPASKQVIMVAKDMRTSYKSSHMLNVRFAQLEAIVSIACGNHEHAIRSLDFCQSAMYSGWSLLNTAAPVGLGKMALFFMRVARDAHAKLGFGHRELCSCFAIRTFAFAFSGQFSEAEKSAALTQRCVAAVVNSMASVREETRLTVFVSLSQLFIAMLQLLKGNSHDAFNACSTSVEGMVASGWTSDNLWVGLGRLLTALSAVMLGDTPKARLVASSMFDKLTSSSQSAGMLSSCMFTIVSAFSGAALAEADIISQLLPFFHPSLNMPAHDDADALWSYPFVTAAGAVACWVSCHTETAQKYTDASLRFLQHTQHRGHPMHAFITPLSIILSAELSSDSLSEATGIRFDSSGNLVSNSMRFNLMNVYVVVDYILKLGDTSRNWLQMSNTVHQLIEELPHRFKDEGLLQLHFWYCHSEIYRRLNKCSEALQRLNHIETRYISLGYAGPHLLLMQVHLAQARCLSSLGRLKDAIDIVRACVMSFEQYGINNALSRTFRVEFGSMLIDVGSFSEASEFFEKGGSAIMLSEVKDVSTLIGIGKLACYRGDSVLLGKAISAIRTAEVSADGNTQTSLDFLLGMQLFLNGDFPASACAFEALAVASENQFGTGHPRTCECRGLQALVAVLLGTQLSGPRDQLFHCREAMKKQGLDASSSSVVRTLLSIEAWIHSELGNWALALSIVKSIVRPCNQCSLDDIMPVYVYLRCCLKLGLHSIILNDFSTLDARFAAAGATSHPIVIMSKSFFSQTFRKFLRVRALVDCGMGQAARDLFAATDEMVLPGQWSIMRLWCSAHVAYDTQQAAVGDVNPNLSSSSVAGFNYDDILMPWLTMQRMLPVTHRLCLRAQFNISCARASLGSCDGVELLEPVLLLQRQHLGSSHSDALECAVALADYLPSSARSSTDSESVVTDAMTQLSQLCGPSSPSFIRAQLVWLRLCCSRGKGSVHFKDVIPTIQSILLKTKGLIWFSAFEEKQLQLLHAQALAQANSWQSAADKLLHWQAENVRDNRLKMHLSIMRSYNLAAQVFGHLGDVIAVERQHDAAVSRSSSQRHLLLWAKGMQLLQMAQQYIFPVASQLNPSANASYDLNKLHVCEGAAKAFISAESSLSSETLTPPLVSLRCHCKLRAAEAFICSGSDSGLVSARESCDACDSLCSVCEPDDPSVRCLLLRMRANVLSACDSDPTFIEDLYKRSAELAPSLPLQRSAHMSLLSLRVSQGHYSEAQRDADVLGE